MSTYPHDQPWEVPPEDRDRSANNQATHKTPYTEPITEAAASPGSRGEYHHRTDREDEDEDSEPGIIARLLTAIFAPIIGFVVIATVSLIWSGILIGALMAYTAAGNPLTGTVLLISVGVWIVGFSAIDSVLLSPAE